MQTFSTQTYWKLWWLWRHSCKIKLLLFAHFAALSKGKVQWVALKAHSVLFKTDKCETCNVIFVIQTAAVRKINVQWLNIALEKRCTTYSKPYHRVNKMIYDIDVFAETTHNFTLLVQVFELFLLWFLFHKTHTLPECSALHMQCYAGWTTKKVYFIRKSIWSWLCDANFKMSTNLW